MLLLDKPQGLSSNIALQKARRLLDARKAGHTGTLDPMATGLLPLCFGEATKFSADLLHADKEYVAEVFFGRSTATGDAEGETVSESPVGFGKKELLAKLSGFKGRISQVPPMYSALKKDGQKLYDLARKGIEVERQPREVDILEIELLGWEAPVARIRVLCSKGTYIRVLAEDIGKALDTCAHLTSLRRTKVADLDISEAVTLGEFEAADGQSRQNLLSPPDRLLSTLAAVELEEEQANRFCHGQSITIKPPESGCKVKVYKLSSDVRKLLGVAALQDDGLLIPERLIANDIES